MKKTFMVLGASILQIPLILQAKKMGYAPVVVSPFKNDPGFRHAAHAVYTDVRDEETILAQARKFNISGITTDQTDLPVPTAAYVAEKMGLPGIGCSTARLFTDKFLMREKCKTLGLKTAEYRVARTPAEALAAFDAINADVIVKPVDSQGSRGISKITHRGDVGKKFTEAAAFSHSKAVLVEQYITGREFVVEAMACDHEFYNLACGDSYYFSIPDTFAPSSRVFPSVANNSTTSRVLAANRIIIADFGLKNGITHSEYIMDGNGDIYLVETAARGGGVFISSDIIPLLTGINTEEYLIHIAAGTLGNAPAVKKTGLACCYIACVLPEGEVISVKGVEEIQSLPYIRGNNLDTIRPGMKTKPFTDKTSRYFAIAFADDHEQLSKRMAKIIKTLQVEIKTDNGIEPPIWA